jgi:hypothetical protein
MSGTEATDSRPTARAGADAAGGRLPDFFIVGQPKSGTSALYAMLKEHPQIYMPDVKEPWFFADELLERPPPRPSLTPRTLEEYRSLFANAAPGQQIGEATALYLWSRTAARRIAEVKPDARIIATLREPVGLLQSLHRQFVEVYMETENDFRAALELEPARREGREVPRHTYWPRALLYSEHVRYVDQLRRYEQRFGRAQMLIQVYDDFRADNDASVRRVLRFIGVDDTLPIAPTEANPTVHVRSQRLNELLHAVSVGHGPVSRGVKATLKAVVPRRLRRGTLEAAKRHVVYGGAPDADEALVAELRARFKGEVEKLSEYIDRDLVALWGYGDVA